MKTARLVLLAVGAALALHSAWADSLTFDEIEHITSGAAIWLEDDHRVGLSHPPLGRMWATWPLRWLDIAGFSHDWPGWREGNGWLLGRSFLFRVNDGEWLGFVSRLNVIALLLSACVCVGWIATRCFGERAGLAALGLAVFSPTLLAHGHLVTTDMPVLAAMLASLLAFRLLLERLAAGRLALASLAVGACATTKLTGVFIAPALFAMAIVRALQPEPLPLRIFGRDETALATRGRRALALAACIALVGIAAVVSIWMVYGLRYAPAADMEANLHMSTAPTPFQQTIESQDDVWRAHLYDWQGEPNSGFPFAFIRAARDGRWLPEAYLLSAAFVLTYSNSGFLLGEVSAAGFPGYFPIAFALKTPLPTLCLLALGVAALGTRRTAVRDPVAFAGVAMLGIVVIVAALGYAKNIGHRHLLPAYPLLFVVASAAVAWLGHAKLRWLLAGLACWLLLSLASVRSNYLGYFNEFAGGPAGGARYLLDSNLDWGQDLKRLAKWAEAEGIDAIKLGYFGGADPTRYALPPLELLPSEIPFGAPLAELGAGVYVISETQLGGVYFPPAREGYFDGPRVRRRFLELRDRTASHTHTEREAWWRLRSGLLYDALREREPDARIGVSLRAYRLDEPEAFLLQAPDWTWTQEVLD